MNSEDSINRQDQNNNPINHNSHEALHETYNETDIDKSIFNAPRFELSESNIKELERSVSPCEISLVHTNNDYEGSSEARGEENRKPNMDFPNFVEIIQEQIDLRLASSDNPTAVMELDLDGNIRYLSQNWETIVGTKIKKIVNKPISNIIIGNDDDSKVFNSSIELMIRDDGSYKVKFVTATDDKYSSTFAESHSSGKITPHNSLEDVTKDIPIQDLQYDPTPNYNTNSESDSSSSTSSKLSNNGNVIELEAQGILIHDSKTKLPTHSIWTIKPFIHIDLDLTLPDQLISLLGFGSEIFEGYLVSLKELGIIDEDSVPQPKTILCRICEQNVPAWFIEKHSDLCIVEHRVSEDLQVCHDAISNQKDLILKLSENIWIQQSQISQNVNNSASVSPSSSPPSSSSSSINLMNSSTSMILDYKGLPLPKISPMESPRLSNQVLVKNASALQSLQTKKFPFGVFQRLVEFCDEALQINPADTNEVGSFQFSPNSERAINFVLNWKAYETSDLSIRTLIEDTQILVNDKIDTLSRLLSILQYSEKIKNEVDELVLQTVRETVAKIKEQTMMNEQNHDSVYSYDDNDSTAIFSNENDQKPSGDELEVPKLSTNNSTNLSIQSPQPSRTRSPQSKLFAEPYVKDEVKSNQSITPRDILLRGRTSSGLLTNSLSTSSLSANSRSHSRNRSKDNNLAESLHDLDLSKKSSEGLSNNSSYSSPRRHLSPVPYIEKQNLSSFQRNTNSRFETNTPLSSPSFAHTEFQHSDKGGHIYEKRAGTGGWHNHNISLNLNFNSNKNSTNKPPLSPLLVSLTPTSKPSTGDIRDYEVLKAISKGAFGSVFLAKRKLTGDYVAIKCLKKRDMVAKNQILNVKSERAVMMRQTDSPYVAQLYSSFQTRDYLYLVMEYLNGGDCATLLKVLGTLGNEWAKRYVAEVVVGVDDLHKRGIIHRDLKPDNLVIDSKGHLKLTDFGLSRMGVVGRQTRAQRKSSTSEQAIDLFRKSLNQANQTAFANVSGLGLTSANDSPSSEASVHKRNTSDTLFSLSPSFDHAKLTPASAAGSLLISPLVPFSDTFGQPLSQQSQPSPLQMPQQKQGNNRQSFAGSFKGGSGRTGSGSLESPLLKPVLARTASESSFSITEDDYPTLSSHNQDVVNSYALFDPENEDSSEMKNFVGTPDYLAPETISGETQSESSDWWSLGCILFEFLFGYPPFHADTPDKVFKNILNCEIDWPPLSEEEELEICPATAKDLIKKLLTLKPEERLGYNGADEIKRHPYFREINWFTLFEEVPSFIPTLDDPESTDYFDNRGADISHFPKEDSDEESKLMTNSASINTTEFGSPSLNCKTNTDDVLDSNIGDFENASASGTGSNTNSNNSNSYGNGSSNSVTGNGKRERRGSRLADPSEFGSFHFRNLHVLEKANKDVINRLKNEHLEHRNSFSSSSSESTTNSRSRGFSFSGTSNNNSPGNPFKRPVSPINYLNHRSSSPNRFEKESQSSPQSAIYKQERVGSAVSTYSSGDEYPFDVGKVSPGSESIKGHNHRSSVHSLSRQVFKPPTNDFSPSSSDNEDSKSLALLRVRKRRESVRRQGSSEGSFSRLGSKHSEELIRPKLHELDVLYCEPIPIVRHTISKLMDTLGCIVVSVSDGDELIRRATSQVKFDLIFTALKSSKVEAPDAVKLIKYTSGINSNTPIIAITGFSKEAIQSEAFDDVLEKPIDIDSLKNCLRKFCYNSTVLDDEAIESDTEGDLKK